MLFQAIVAIAAITISGLLLGSEPDPPPTIVYVVMAGAVTWFATWLRAIITYREPVSIRPQVPDWWHGKNGGPTWMGRPTGEQLGAFWRFGRRTTASPSPPQSEPTHRAR